eukprot:12406914-Karenia_brevis.AAC.1
MESLILIGSHRSCFAGAHSSSHQKRPKSLCTTKSLTVCRLGKESPRFGSAHHIRVTETLRKHGSTARIARSS